MTAADDKTGAADYTHLLDMLQKTTVQYTHLLEELQAHAADMPKKSGTMLRQIIMRANDALRYVSLIHAYLPRFKWRLLP